MPVFMVSGYLDCVGKGGILGWKHGRGWGIMLIWTFMNNKGRLIIMKIAHSKEKSQETQSIAEHSIGTAKLAESFSIVSLKKLVYNMALLHDVGKYQDSFQDKIIGKKNIRVEHSTCGAIEAKKLFGNNGGSLIAQYCIAGHHSGLPDGGTMQDTADDITLCGRLAREPNFDDYSDYKKELNIGKIDMAELGELMKECVTDEESMIECFSFVTRYCFSCLTDADTLDTAFFCTGREDMELESDFKNCLSKLDARIQKFRNETALQKGRDMLQRQVYDKVDTDSEIYLMNMPTGSGKTLCSMKFALTRALKTGKRRIIYVIPYNSIIDQTVSVFEEIFGKSANILRHQSSFCVDDIDCEEDYKTHLKNVTENWNARMIVTTSVQFFESIFDNKRSRLRKLHNFSNSMIIFDEAHLMPVEYLQPCLRAVSYVTRLLDSEAVFLTATMPDFNTLVKKYALPTSKITELIHDKKLFECFRKGNFVNIGNVSEEALLADAEEKPSSLIVVNKRTTASKLYDLAVGKKYHLSTYMAAYDRKHVIEEIETEIDKLYHDYPDLKNVPEDRHIMVISTSLIEAGVDLDFFAVYRELFGLDSILQAGGRCNREGKRENSEIYIFNFGDSSDKARVNITKSLIKKYDDISCSECVTEYYDQLYNFNDEVIRENSIAKDCPGIDSIDFAKYARKFRMIDSNTVSVAVERDEESTELIRQLKATEYTNHRKLQKYTFTVYENELQQLMKQGVVEEFGGVWCLTNQDYYSTEKGVSFEAKDYVI